MITKILYALLFIQLLVTGVLYSQSEQNDISQKWENTIGLSLLSVSSASSDFTSSVPYKGFGIRLNGMRSRFLGREKHSKVGFGLQLNYAKGDRQYERIANLTDIRSIQLDTAVNLRSGTLNYQDVSLYVPLTARIYFGQSSRLFTGVKVVPRFTIANNTDFQYDEYDLDFTTELRFNEVSDQSSPIKQAFINFDVGAGVGYTFGRVELELEIEYQSITYKGDHYIRGDELLGFGFKVMMML